MFHFLKLGLMVDMDVQGTSKITEICSARPRGKGKVDMFSNV